MNAFASIVGLVTASLVAGCVSLSNAPRPDIAMPAAFDASSAEATPVDREWWRAFDNDALNTLVSRGLVDGFDITIAAERLAQARASATIASAPLFPSLGLEATAGKRHGQSASQQSVLFQASYELDFWGRYRAASRSADALADASAFDRETVTTTLAASIVDTYFQVRSLIERERLARSIADNARRLLDLLEIQVTGGIASDLEVAQQRTTLATFESNAATLAQQREQAMHLLAVLVGRNPEGFDVANDRDLADTPAPAVMPGLPSTLLERRPDIRAAEARLRAAHFDVAAARAAFYPDVALTGSAGLLSVSHFLPSTFASSVAANLLQPIFEGGRLRGTLDLDQARERELIATYRKSVASAFQDVEDALTAAARTTEAEQAQGRAVEASRRAEELAEIRFRYGTITYITVLDSQRVRAQAEDTLLQLRFQRLEAAVALFRALGGGFGDTAPVALAR